MITLDANSDIGLYEQLYQQLRDDIATGRLPKNSRLKSLRELEQDLNVSRTTISRAYQQLISEGYVRASQGSGYYVEDIGPTDICGIRNVKQQPVAVETENRYDFDFSPYYIESGLFPWKKWRKALVAAMDYDSFAMSNRVVSSKGTLHLRENLARFLYQHRGVRCSPEQIVVCTNDLRGVDVLVSMLDPNECRVAFEEPGIEQMRTLIRDWGFDVFSIPALGEKTMPLLEQANCNVLFTMPSCQLPEGNTMPLRDRNLLLRWATEHDAYIIEFDHHARFQGYGNTEVPSMQSLDRFDNVIYVGSLGEVLPAPLGLAYLVLPPSLLEKYRMRYEAMPPMLPEFYEQAFADILEDGSLVRHIRKVEVENKAKLDLLAARISECMPSQMALVNATISGYAIARIDSGYDRDELIERLEQEEVRIYSIYDACHDQCTSWDDLFVLGFASLSREDIDEGLRIIANVLKAGQGSSEMQGAEFTAHDAEFVKQFKTEFEDAIAAMEKDVAVELVEKVIERGMGSLGYIEEGLSLGIQRIGDMFDAGEIGVIDLIEAAEVLDAALKVFTSQIAEEDRQMPMLADVVMYTVEGDLHDLGRNIVRVLLEANNFRVHDLGSNVVPEDVLAKAEEVGASIIMGSALMTTTMPAQKDLVVLMEQRGVRDKYFVMFGGAPVTEEWVKEIGGDAYTNTATDAVLEVKKHVYESASAHYA